MKFITSINMVATGCRIKELRKSHNISVSYIQHILGFNTQQAIYKWQRGDALPSIDNLVVLSSIFEVPIEAILVLNKRPVK